MTRAISIGDYNIRSDCRLCNSSSLSRVLDLPDTPLANEFVNASDQGTIQKKFPLFVSRCNQCGHIQLPVVVDPERLFRNYVYVSGTSKAFVAHFESLATEIIVNNAISSDSLIVEIGSNDGTALKAFKKHGMRVFGIDPAINIAEIASRDGIQTSPNFFTKELAEEILERAGHAHVVLANNVFAHADDLNEILNGVITLLEPKNGIFVFEVQYLADMLEHGYFDMIYHEHLSYHSVAPLVPFLQRKGLNIIKCQHIHTHGGSIRVTCGMRNPTASEKAQVLAMIETEAERLEQHDFRKMAETIEQASADLRNLVRSTSRKLWGFGAPAKLTTLFYALRLERANFFAVIDDSPLKQGLFTPGEHLPVISFDEFKRHSTTKDEIIVIFAWNFASYVHERFKQTSHQLYIPLPQLTRLH